MSTQSEEIIPQHLLKSSLWSVLAAVVIYGALVVASDINTIGESIVSIGLVGWLIILGLSLINYGLRFARWKMYLHLLGIRVSALLSLAYYLGGFAFTTSPGKVGEAIRSLYLKQHEVSFVHSLAAFFTERLIDLVAIVLLALIAALVFPDYRWLVIAITFILVIIISVIHARWLHRLLRHGFQNFSSVKIRNLGAGLIDLLESSSFLLRSSSLFSGLVLALIAWGAEGIALHIILQKLNVDSSLALAIGIYSISILAGAISFIPGGLGSTEAVMILLLTLVGLDTPTAIAATLICRIATLWFAVFIGATSLILLELNFKTISRESL